MSNMAVEDILDELGAYGIVSLRKGLFSKGASPHLRGQRELWRIEVTLPGYLSRYTMPAHINAEGASIRAVCEEAYQTLENYVFSPQATEDRQRYEQQHTFYRERYEGANAYLRSGFNPVRNPGDLIPPIVWGERRGGFVT